jgi:hypothetical protein
MKKDIKIAKGRFAVIKINGKIMQTVEATSGIRIEGGDNCEIVSKTESQLTAAEKGKMKVKDKLKKGK